MTHVAVSRDIPVLDADPFAMDVLRSSYKFHEMVREIGPASFIEMYGTYAVGRYDEVRIVQSDWENFTSTAGAGLTDIRKPGAWRQPGPIVEADPPNHTHIRGVLTTASRSLNLEGADPSVAEYIAYSRFVAAAADPGLSRVSRCDFGSVMER